MGAAQSHDARQDQIPPPRPGPAASYTRAGRVKSGPVGRAPGAGELPAAPEPMSGGPGRRDVHRPVHARVSRQYQRTSAQALPPSATMYSAGRRIPHIQQDLTAVAWSRTGVRNC